MEVTIEEKSFAALPAAATGKNKYVLEGMHVAENGVTTCTNSFMVLQVIPPAADAKSPPDEGVVIPQKAIQKITPLTAKKTESRNRAPSPGITIKDNPDDLAQVILSGEAPDRAYQISTPQQDGIFPDTRKFLTEAASAKHFKFTMRIDLIRRLAKALTLFTKGCHHDAPTVTISGTKDPMGMIYIEAEDRGHTMRGILMPANEGQPKVKT